MTRVERFDDDELLEILGQALEATDPLPEQLVTAAKAAYTWRTIDVELAELVFDSNTDELVGVRSAETARQMTFRSPGVEIEVMIVSDEARGLVGQLVPPQPASVELRFDQETRHADADHLGRFTFEDIPPGPIQLLVDAGAGGRVITDWVVL